MDRWDLFCSVVFEGNGPVGHQHGNPAVGWGVFRIVPFRGAEQISPTLRNVKQCKAWAESRFPIVGWSEHSSSPYKQSYAMVAVEKGKGR